MEKYLLIEHTVNDGQSINALFGYATKDEALDAYYDFVAYQRKLATVTYLLAQVMETNGGYVIGTTYEREVEPEPVNGVEE